MLLTTDPAQLSLQSNAIPFVEKEKCVCVSVVCGTRVSAGALGGQQRLSGTTQCGRGCWKLKSGPLQGQQELLMAGPSPTSVSCLTVIPVIQTARGRSKRVRSSVIVSYSDVCLK